MKKHGIEIATTDVLGNKIEPKLLVGDFNGYGSGEIFDANAVHLLVLQQIADLVNFAPEALDTLGEIADVLNLKEDAIADLEEIRSGAALGATSYQKPLSGIPYSDMAEAVLLLLDKAGTALQSHQDISHKVDRNELEEVAFTGSYQSLSNKPFIPTLVSQLANDAGYLTLHQDISMKADRSELFSREYDDLLNKPVIPVVPENVGDFINNVGYLTQHQDISGKQDVIADLETIRAGAALGATSIQQHLSLANYYTKGEVDTILTTIEGEIPTKLSLLQNDPGYLTAHLSLADYLRIADLPLNLSSYTNDVPFLTQHLDISGKADKSTTVTNVAYDTTNKKFTKTINGSTTDIVNASTVVSGGITVVNNTPTLDWNTTSTIGSVQGTELKVKLPANPNTDTNTAALKVSDTTNKKINTVESPNSYILFEGGTNEFTVKDGVNSFKVSVTPSITNNVTGSSLTANNIILGNGNSTVKDSGKAIESGSNTTLSANDAKIPTSLVVKNYIDTSLTSVLRYKGTIGSSGATVTALPATHYVGWVYVVAKAGTYAGKACEVGDYVICRIDGTTANDAHWDVVNGENLVSSANNTAAWGSAVIVGNVDGTDLKFTMPANPNTWRGILNNLTSTSTSDSLSAYQGYLLANGSARDDTKLPLSGGTLTGTLTIASSISGSYNEGIRITRASNNWAGITFGSTGTSGAPTGGWFAATNPSNQFIIQPDNSNSTDGLCLNKAGDLKWRNNTVYHAGNLPAYPTKASWNYDDVYLKLTGGILSGSDSILTLKSAGTNSWIYFKTTVSNTETYKASVGYYGGFAFVANETTYARIGVNDSGTPQYWSSTSSSTAKTLIHAGNIGSYNAGTATTLQTSRTLWGQSFDGSGNVSGVLSDATQVQFNTYSNISRGSLITSGLGNNDVCIHCYDGTSYTKFRIYASTSEFYSNISLQTNRYIHIGTIGENGANNKTGYISAGAGYSVNSGRYGLRFLVCDQADTQTGLGQDLVTPTGWTNAYNLCIAGGNASSDYGYISFVTHKVNSTTYRYLGGFRDNAGTITFQVMGDVYTSSKIRANNLLIGTGTSGRVIDTYTSGGKLLLQYGSSGDISMCYGGGYVGINNNNPEVELDVNGDMFIGGYGYIEQLAVGFKSHTQQEAINAKDGNIHMFTVSSWSGNLTVNNPIAGLIITVIFKNTNATTGFAVPLGNFAKSENVPVIANGGVSIVQLVCTDSTQGSIYPASVKQYS